MFRNDYQKSTACKTLLALVFLGELWNDRPTEEALAFFSSTSSHRQLSPGQKTLLKAVFSIWNPYFQEARIGEAIVNLDSSAQKALWELLLASAEKDKGEAVDLWLKEWTPCPRL